MFYGYTDTTEGTGIFSSVFDILGFYKFEVDILMHIKCRIASQ